MKIIVATPPGKFPGNHYPCPFPSRWTSLIPNYPVFIFFPYELAYLSSLLKRDIPQHEVKMVDGTRLRFTAEDYIKYLEYEKPDWLIFEADTVTYGEIMKVVGAIKRKIGTRIIMTGQYATVYPEKVLEDGNDFACIGEYEESVRDLLRGDDPKSIGGLYPNMYRKILDIDSLPDPEDDDIRRIDYSYSGGYRWTKYRSIEVHASRGCPYKCDFCVAGTVYYEKPNWRMRSPNRIINEIETMRRKYSGIEGVFFDEETHIVKKQPILDLCKAIVDSGNNDLHYEAMANHLLLDEEILLALSKAGYYRLRVGIETVDDKTSRSIGRKTKPDRLYEILGVAKKLGIEIYGTFIVGASGSSREGDEKTIEYGRKLIKEGLIFSWQASIAVPHPGTPFYEKAKANGWFATEEHVNFNGTTGSVLNYPEYSSEEILKTSQKLSLVFEEALQNKSEPMFRSTSAEKAHIKPELLDQIREKMKKVTALFNERKNEETVVEAKKIIDENPLHFRARHILATAYERMGDFHRASENFIFIVSNCDDYNLALDHAAGAHFHLGWINHMTGHRENALLHFKECLHLNPNHILAKKFFWLINFEEESKIAEGEFWGDFEKIATSNNFIPPWVDLSEGEKILGFNAFWANPEVENILRGAEKRKIIETLNKPEINNVLEIGCGSGWLSLELARNGKKVTGIDLSDYRIELARKVSKSKNIDIEYIQADATQFCGNGRKFDAIVAWDSLHHIPNLAKLLVGIKSSLNPDGLFIMYDHLGPNVSNSEMAKAIMSTPKISALPKINGKEGPVCNEELSPYEDVGSFMLEEMIANHFDIAQISSHIAFTAQVCSEVDFSKADLEILKELKNVEEDLIKQEILKGEYVFIESRLK